MAIPTPPPTGRSAGDTDVLAGPAGVRSDETLLAEVVSGDRNAFAELYVRHAGRIGGVVTPIVLDRALVEEVIQEVFLTVWLRANRFDPARGSVSFWLTMIARSSAIDRVRHVQRSRNRDNEYLHMASFEPRHDAVVDAVTVRSDHAQVRAALVALTPLQHEVLTMAFYGGHTYAEISSLLGVPLGTVKSRARDGLIRLAHHIARPRPGRPALEE